MTHPELMAFLSDAGNLWALPHGYLDSYRAEARTYTGPALEARAPGSVSRVDGNVGVIGISGPIDYRPSIFTALFGGAAVTSIRADFRQAMADPNIKGVLFALDSPGGTVTGIPELVGEILAAREAGTKPIIAQIDPMAASAASWLASAADTVVMPPSGITGALGIITSHQDVSGALAQEGVKVTQITAGEFKGEGSPYGPLSDDAKEAIQARVDAMYDQMNADVGRGRRVSATEARDGFGRGRILTAKDAKAAGLVDRIGTMDDTVARLTGRKAGGLRAEDEEAAIADALSYSTLADIGILTRAEAVARARRRLLL